MEKKIKCILLNDSIRIYEEEGFYCVYCLYNGDYNLVERTKNNKIYLVKYIKKYCPQYMNILEENYEAKRI